MLKTQAGEKEKEIKGIGKGKKVKLSLFIHEMYDIYKKSPEFHMKTSRNNQ